MGHVVLYVRICAFIVKKNAVIDSFLVLPVHILEWNEITLLYYTTGTVLDTLHVFSNFIPYRTR